MSDRLFGLTGMALAAFYLWAASIIPDSFMTDVVGPRTFPYIVGTVLAVCSAYFLIRPDDDPTWPDLRDFGEILFAAVVLLLYAMMLPKVGFVISTVFATAYLTWRLETKPLNSLVVGVATSVGIYGVFRGILGLSLAKGPFGF